MIFLVLRAYALLVSFERNMSRRDFQGIYRRVEQRRLQPSGAPASCEKACRAVNFACVLYFKEVQCLQRSAALVCLLRDLGISATLVIGAQRLPFRAHAWVEVNRCVVNDSVSAVELYGVLDRL
jgi:transglutaminase superfamily protein